MPSYAEPVMTRFPPLPQRLPQRLPQYEVLPNVSELESINLAMRRSARVRTNWCLRCCSRLAANACCATRMAAMGVRPALVRTPRRCWPRTWFWKRRPTARDDTFALHTVTRATPQAVGIPPPLPQRLPQRLDRNTRCCPTFHSWNQLGDASKCACANKLVSAVLLTPCCKCHLTAALVKCCHGDSSTSCTSPPASIRPLPKSALCLPWCR